MKVRDAMTRRVWACRPDEPADSAARLMWDYDVGAVLVTDDHGKLVGVVTDRDLCMGAYCAGTPLANFPVSDAMSHVVFTVGPDEPLAVAEQVMRSHQVRRVPVLEGGTLVGILSLGDVARAEAETATTTNEFAAMMRDIVKPRAHIGGLTHAAE